MESIVRTGGAASPRGRTQIRTTVIERAPLESELLERENELTRVADLIASVSVGGRLLAIEGPPGVGKTALIARAKTLAQEAGLLALGRLGARALVLLRCRATAL